MTEQTQTVGRRRHLARRWWGPAGLTIRCTCGQWQSTRGSRREQDDAHRNHRWCMGEIARPDRLSPVDELRAQLEEVRGAAQRDATIVDLVAAWVASTEHGEAAAEVAFLLRVPAPAAGGVR